MSRKLKVFIVAAVMATSAMVASAAQAKPEITGFETGEGGTRIQVPSTITATTAPGQIEQIHTAQGTIDCHITRHGYKEGSTIIWTSETFLDSNTEGSSCTTTTGGQNLKTHINNNGCEWKVNVSSKTAIDEYKGNISLICPAGKRVDIKVTKPVGEETQCTIEIPEQKELGSVVFKNNTAKKPMDLTLEAKVGGLKYITTGGVLNCGVANGEHSGGEYTGVSTLQGLNQETGKPIDLEVSGE